MSLSNESLTEGSPRYYAFEQPSCNVFAAISRWFRARFSWTLLALVGWGVSIAAGLFLFLTYSQTPGLMMQAPTQWPVGSSLETDPTRWTLVMVAHPKCPCTAASVHELRELIAWTDTPLTTHVVFLSGTEDDPNWFSGRTVEIARASSGVQVHFDPKNQEVERFATATSGHVLLYDTSGHLRYSGGITPARGHRGANRGSGMILSLLNDRVSTGNQLPVYGCAMFCEKQSGRETGPPRGEPRDD